MIKKSSLKRYDATTQEMFDIFLMTSEVIFYIFVMSKHFFFIILKIELKRNLFILFF